MIVNIWTTYRSLVVVNSQLNGVLEDVWGRGVAQVVVSRLEGELVAEELSVDGAGSWGLPVEGDGGRGDIVCSCKHWLALRSCQGTEIPSQDL